MKSPPKGKHATKNHFRKSSEPIFNGLGFSNAKAFALLIWSALFYLLYLACSDLIHQTWIAPIDTTTLTPWIAKTVKPDGIELYLMTLAMPLFLFGAYLISVSGCLNKLNILFQKPWITALYFLIPATLFTLHYLRKETVDFRSFVLFITAVIGSFAFYYLKKIKLSVWVRWILEIMLFILLVFFGFTINNLPSIFDYGYLIGPARKLLQGEVPGSFFMQYNFFTTFSVLIMLKLQLLIHQMYLIFMVVFITWIFLYKHLAKAFFMNNIIVSYFLIALLLIRGVAILGGAVAVPQVGPLRLDLWVPLLMVVLYFGFESKITALSFSTMYLFDDVFGFLYLCLYLFLLFIILCARYKETGKSILSVRLLHYLIPIAIAFLIHFLVFGTLTSPAGKIYSDYHIGFLPISPKSSFWLMVWLLPVCLYLLVQEKKNRGLVFFIFGLVCIQLTYFFGRSHDNNLRNISGIFLFVLFWAIDKLYSAVSRKQFTAMLISLLIGFMVLNYNAFVLKALMNISKFSLDTVLAEHPKEMQLRSDGLYLKTLTTDKILIISGEDAYINYRLGYRQIGYFSPFAANLKILETTRFLYYQTKKQYRLIAYPGNIFPACMESLNNEMAIISKNEQFVADSLQNNLFEIRLIKKK